jgi:hypothetical protein
MRARFTVHPSNVRDGAAIVLGAWAIICMFSLAFVALVNTTPVDSGLQLRLLAAAAAALTTAAWLRRR